MKKVLFFSLLAVVAFLALRMGEKPAEKNEKLSDIAKESSGEGKCDLSNSLRLHTPESIEPDSASEFILNILDVKRPVLHRAPEIMKLRQKKLNSADERALLEHLTKVHTDESQAIKNDIIEHMVRYGSDQKQVGHALLDILKNSQQDKVIREYTLQYIPEYYMNRWNPAAEWDISEDDEREIFNSVLWEMTDLTEGSMAGGALFALFRLADKYGDLNQKEVFNKSLNVMLDTSYMNPNRMGAMQILAFSKNEKYFDEARKIVLDENQPVLLKVTAIHTATQSKFLDKDFYTHLKTLAKGGDGIHPTLSKCASLTLSKIKN